LRRFERFGWTQEIDWYNSFGHAIQSLIWRPPLPSRLPTSIVPFPVNPSKTKWVVAANPRTIHADGITGSRAHSAENMRHDAEGFWIESDKRWIPGHSQAKVFDSAAEAQAYIDQHHDELYSTPLLY
jgi:hypothetical protein